MPSGDPRVDAGLAALGRARARRLADGDTQAGWKIGFGSPSGLELLGLTGPIIGTLWSSGAHRAGDPVPIADWASPVIECEVAAYVGRDIPPGTPADDIDAHVVAWGPAFEFADIDAPPRDVARVLEGNIFHRGYQLASPRRGMDSSEAMSLVADVTIDDVTQRVEHLTALTGDLAQVIARAADLAPDVGRGLRAGDVILTGSIVAPVPVVAGTRVEFLLGDFPALSTRFA